MQKTVIHFTYHKCLVCKRITKSMSTTCCRCGRFMYPIGTVETKDKNGGNTNENL